MEKHCNAQVEKEFNLNGRLPESLGKWYLLQRLLPSHALRSVLGEDAIPVPRACNKKVAAQGVSGEKSMHLEHLDGNIRCENCNIRSGDALNKPYQSNLRCAPLACMPSQS